MIRKMTQIAMFAMFALSLMGLTANAQKTEKKEDVKGGKTPATKEARPPASAEKRPNPRPAQARPTIIIAEVLKRDAAAKPNPNGAGRLVPVDVRWDAKLPAGAKLIEMNCVLRTKNTDGQTSVVEHLMSVEKFVPGKSDGGTILLPMAEGIFAKEFTLTMKGKFRTINVNEEIINVSVTKSGTFPVIAEKK